MSNAAAVNAETHEFSSEDLPPAARQWNVPNRRLDRRDPVAVRANLTVPGRSVLPGRTLDISRGGASMIVPFELAPGQDCVIDFELQACGDSSIFHIPAEVRYAVGLGSQRFRIGLKFGEMDEKTAALVDGLLKSTLK